MAEASTFDSIKMWNCAALKNFCRKKGLFSNGKKEELVARVFAAKEMKLPDVITKEEERKLKAVDYSHLLQTSIGRQPDPYDLTDWCGEESGKCIWPPTMYCDICTYFLTLTGDINRSVSKTALNAYKEGKAFSYFDCGWLKEVMYHPINEQSPFCYVKSKCTPSQRINDVPHDVWIMLNKKTGAIQSAYCTCFAGLGSTCNHVAAILFKMDFFWRQGMTRKSCTDLPCQWNKYGEEKPLGKPLRVEEFDIRKPGFGKNIINKCNSNKKKPSIENIDPFSFSELSDALISSCPEAVVFQGQKQTSPDDVIHVEVSTSISKPLFELFRNCESQEEIFMILSSLTREEVSIIEKATRGQSLNDEWINQRMYRITSSIVHNVCTRMKTLESKSSKRNKDPTCLLNRIIKHKKYDFNNVPQLKYGKEMESEARNHYQKIMSSKHKSFAVGEVGLVVSQANSHCAASPDGLVTCECCQPGLLEIKCPFSVAHTSPSAKNLSYLKQVGSEVNLLKTSPYFSQVQWQMGVCEKNCCDFFVFTRYGFYLERINFDKAFFESMLSTVDKFYTQYVIPAILDGNKGHTAESLESSTNLHVECQSTPGTGTAESTAPTANLNISHLFSREQTGPKTKRRKVLKKNSEPVYLCGSCSEVCEPLEAVEAGSDNSVQCDICLIWYHFMCVLHSYNNDDDDKEIDWVCHKCKENET